MNIKLKKELFGLFLSLLCYFIILFLLSRIKSFSFDTLGILFGLLTIPVILYLAKRFGYYDKLGIKKEGFFIGVTYGIFFVLINIVLQILKGDLKLSFFSSHIISLPLFIGLFLAAFLEELVFRGVLVSILKEFKGVLFALFISSLLWGFSHLEWLFFSNLPSSNFLISTSFLGLTYGVIFIRSKNIFSSTITHFLGNITIIYLLEGSGKPLFISLKTIFVVFIVFYPLLVDYLEAKRTNTKQSFSYSKYLSFFFIIFIFVLLIWELAGYW